MKRSWIGFGLLVVLLAASVLVTWGMGRIHQPIVEDLQRAAQAALEEDWENGERFFASAQGQWEKWEHLRACFADHSPVEEIDAAFSELAVYCAARENAAFAAGCMETGEKVAAVGEAHGLVWWNIL